MLHYVMYVYVIYVICYPIDMVRILWTDVYIEYMYVYIYIYIYHIN